MILNWNLNVADSGGAIAFHTISQTYHTNLSSIPDERVFRIGATTPRASSKEITFSGNQARMGGAISVFGEVWYPTNLQTQFSCTDSIKTNM